ncbi:hypothetical protein ACIQXA_01955 [Streptomyces massasporeus]|uniref:hypothetical protein n=1 Tax=Streptomyces massasporeus TaxID=67324 RepID=UPI00382F152E
MDLTGLALRFSAARPRVLLATLPGGTAARLRAERLARLRDWPLAGTPAEADLLLVVGQDSSRLRASVNRLWQDMPAPRARVHADEADDVEAALEAGRIQLGSPDVQHRQCEASAETARYGDDGCPHHQESSGAHHHDEEAQASSTRERGEDADGHGSHNDEGAENVGGHETQEEGGGDGGARRSRRPWRARRSRRRRGDGDAGRAADGRAGRGP